MQYAQEFRQKDAFRTDKLARKKGYGRKIAMLINYIIDIVKQSSSGNRQTSFTPAE